MDWTSLIGPAVVAAAIAGIVSVITLLMNRATTLTTHAQRLAFDREQAERKLSADIALAEKKLGLDREFAAMSAVGRNRSMWADALRSPSLHQSLKGPPNVNWFTLSRKIRALSRAG